MLHNATKDEFYTGQWNVVLWTDFELFYPLTSSDIYLKDVRISNSYYK